MYTCSSSCSRCSWRLICLIFCIHRVLLHSSLLVIWLWIFVSYCFAIFHSFTVSKCVITLLVAGWMAGWLAGFSSTHRPLLLFLLLCTQLLVFAVFLDFSCPSTFISGNDEIWASLHMEPLVFVHLHIIYCLSAQQPSLSSTFGLLFPYASFRSLLFWFFNHLFCYNLGGWWLLHWSQENVRGWLVVDDVNITFFPDFAT